MPVYEYRCEACGEALEAIQKFSDAPLADCEKCGAKGTLQKQVSLSSFALKGSGWYTTDYKKTATKAADAAAPVATPAPAAKPDSSKA